MGTADVQGELWGPGADDWARLQEPKHAPLWEAMLDAASVTAQTRLLDAGCGGGGSSMLAAERGATVTGLDATPELVRIAAARVPTGEFRVGEIQDLPHEDNAFDAIIAANCVQYAADPVATLREFARVCRPEGRIVAALFAPAAKVAFAPIFAAVRDTLPEPPPGDGPFALSAPGKLESLFAEAGLEVFDRGEVDCPFHYPDFETFWRASSAAGPFLGAMRAAGEERLRQALHEAAEQFRDEDGSLHIEPNTFKYVAATC